MRDPDSTATVFRVTDAKRGESFIIDAEPEGAGSAPRVLQHTPAGAAPFASPLTDTLFSEQTFHRQAEYADEVNRLLQKAGLLNLASEEGKAFRVTIQFDFHRDPDADSTPAAA